MGEAMRVAGFFPTKQLTRVLVTLRLIMLIAPPILFGMWMAGWVHPVSSGGEPPFDYFFGIFMMLLFYGFPSVLILIGLSARRNSAVLLALLCDALMFSLGINSLIEYHCLSAFVRSHSSLYLLDGLLVILSCVEGILILAGYWRWRRAQQTLQTQVP
jgi:hypothetical protein